MVRIWHVSRNTIIFLIASALFRDGLNGVFQFGGPLARQTFGFSASGVLIFGIVANLIAGISTILLGRLDDRIGPKRLIIFSLIVLSACGMGVFIGHADSAWCFGCSASSCVVSSDRLSPRRGAPHSDLPARVPGRGLRSLRDHWQSRLVPGTGTIWPLCHGGPCHHRW
ncbi:permease [Cutibacterium acnes JCM 18918]|nr:permease [Cutibacterium acnes JCM 18918]